MLDDGGTLVLTHVVPPSMRPATLSATEPSEPTAELQARFDDLREALRSCAPPGVRIEQRLVTDDPVSGILTTADHLDADLIAVGTHGPGLVARLLLGSVAESVLRRTARPVVASPPLPAGVET